jgi:hypothetical protein
MVQYPHCQNLPIGCLRKSSVQHPAIFHFKVGFTHSMPFPCRAHAIPLPCRAAKGLECVFPICFTLCGRVWFTLAMPHPCRSTQGHGTVQPSRRPLGCQRSASSGYHAEFHKNCYQKHTDLRCRWPLWNPTFIVDEEKLIILVQGHECLYNLQHKDYDNNLVKDNCWKEMA